MPKVSIIIPAYNSGKYIDKTIKGIISQTYKDWEVIVIDDCSVDDTKEIVMKYQKTDKRIKYLQLDKNSGPAMARNMGIEKSNSRYIAFCDSDDIWMPEKLEKQLSEMEISKSVICFTSYTKMSEDGVITKSIVRAPCVVKYEDMLKSNYIGCSTAIYDTQICGKVYMPNIIKRQDYGLWLKILKDGCLAIGLYDSYVYYRVRKGSVSGNKILAAKYHWKILREVAELPIYRAARYFLDYAINGIKKTSL